VTATALAQSITSYTPLIFLKACEATAGSRDVSITPFTATFRAYDGINTQIVTRRLLLNTTSMKEHIRPKYPKTMTSRYTFFAANIRVLGSNSRCPINAAYPYTFCKSFGTSFVLQETKRETGIGIGVDLNLPKEIPYGGVMMTRKLARTLGVKKGDKIILRLFVSELLQQMVVQFNYGRTTASDRIDDSSFYSATAYLPFYITETLNGNMLGKFDADNSDIVITEMKYFMPLLVSHMPWTTARYNKNYNDFINYLRDIKMQEYASQVIFNMENRMEIYKNSNFDEVQNSLIKFSSEISLDLGIFSYRLNLPLYKLLSKLKFVQLFLGITLSLILAILFILGTILIYNILLVSVETKTFEFGVIRMIGLSKTGIAQLIFVQALSFAVPAIILGLIASVPLLMYIGNILESKLSTPIPISPSQSGIIWAVCIGLLIPIISSYYPLKEALKKNLNLALDLVHSKTNAIQISLEFKGKGIPWTQITFGFLALVFGVMVHVMLPLSLLSLNIGLLLGMFFVILIGLIFGLTLLSLNFEHIMERLITMTCFFWTKASFRDLIMKNLVAHKIRNRQTAIMYSLSLGFVVFLMVALHQQLNTMAFSVQAEKGALIEIKSATDGEFLDQKQLESFMANIQDSIESYAWITQDLASYAAQNNLDGVSVTHTGKLYKLNPFIRGVSPTIFQTTLNKFLAINDQDKNTGLDLGEQLYTARGAQGVIIGETYKNQLGVSLDIDTSVIIQIEDGVNSYSEELRVLATLESAPGFTFSRLPSVLQQDMLVSLPTYARLARNVTKSVRDLPMERLLVKAKGDQADLVAKLIQYNADHGSPLLIWNYKDTESNLKSNQETLSFIFMLIEVLAMVFSFFSLVTSMSTNILEQTKEIAVLRAIGMSRRKINFLFVCEAFVLVLSSAIFGVLIGTAVAWVLAAQQVLFTQLPFIFEFPFKGLVVVFIGAVVSAFLSSYVPSSRITKHSIAKIMKIGA